MTRNCGEYSVILTFIFDFNISGSVKSCIYFTCEGNILWHNQSFSPLLLKSNYDTPIYVFKNFDLGFKLCISRLKLISTQLRSIIMDDLHKVRISNKQYLERSEMHFRKLCEHTYFKVHILELNVFLAISHYTDLNQTCKHAENKLKFKYLQFKMTFYTIFKHFLWFFIFPCILIWL